MAIILVGEYAQRERNILFASEGLNPRRSYEVLSLRHYSIIHKGLEVFLHEKATKSSVFMGLGANLPHPLYSTPMQTLEAALTALGPLGVKVLRVSPWYRTAPVPASDQPLYVNAVAELVTDLPADRLLGAFHAVEEAFGRVRSVPNAPRWIDLDLLDFRGEIAAGGPGRATLPHPRLAERAFVLRPLADLAPDWRHPVSGASMAALLAALPPGQATERLG